MLVINYGIGLFGRTAECFEIGSEFYLYGVTQGGDPRVLPSIGMARELAASALLR
jgi:hypothetical protein